MSQASQNVIADVLDARQWAAAGQRRWLAVINLLLMLAAVGLFVAYLWLNNQTAAHGFTIRGLEQQISDLRDDQRRMDMEVLSRRAMGSVEARVQGLGFVPVNELDYLIAGTSGVARR